MTRINLPILIALTVTGLYSCTKKTEPNAGGHSSSPSAPGPITGVYTLVRGGTDTTIDGSSIIYKDDSAYHSTLAFYDLATQTVTPDRFSRVNGEPLGLLASDMGRYGSKLYIVMTGSRNITVVDIATTRLLARTAIQPPQTPPVYYAPRPRQICFLNGLAYIGIGVGSIAIMDTTTLQIIKYMTPSAPVGLYGPVAANGKLYFSGGYGIVSIDPNTGALIHSIPVYCSPRTLSADAAGNVYIQSMYDTSYEYLLANNFQGQASGITVVSSATDQVLYKTPAYTPNIAPIVVSRDTAFVVTGNSGASDIYTFNTVTFTPFPLFNPNSLGEVTTMCADSTTGQLFLGDSHEENNPYGTVKVYLGYQLLYSFVGGKNLVKIIPVR